MLASVASIATEADLVKIPFAYVQVTPGKMEYIKLKAQAKQWHSPWLRARQREQEVLVKIAQIKVRRQDEISALEVHIDQLKKQLAQMQHLVFGRSTERTSKKSDNQQGCSGSDRNSPGIIAAPESAIWVEILIHKYAFGISVNGRIASDDLSQWLPWLIIDARLQELGNHSPPCENGSVTSLS